MSIEFPASEALVEAVASDLYRDRLHIAVALDRLRTFAPDLAESAIIVAPARGGKLSGGTFMGLPVIEADVPTCMVPLPSDPPV